MAAVTKHGNINRLAYLFLLPAFLMLGLVVIYPFVYNVIISFSNMNLTHFRDWKLSGLGNYLQVLSEDNFWYYFFKTVL
ncbi:MAG: sugar ABC transporter permease, partial [Calditrichaeota bacterium]|nr:sugar ABC transporter permease [Calditrichota bacterium]